MKKGPVAGALLSDPAQSEAAYRSTARGSVNVG
jgi:hypothetical protein